MDGKVATGEKGERETESTVLPGAPEKENDWEPTEGQVASACLSKQHDYGLLPEAERASMRFEAREWLRAWLKEMPRTPALRKVIPPTERPQS